MANLDFDRLQLGELTTTGKGAKSIPFLYGKEQVIWQPVSPMTVAYEPGVFSGEDTGRVNICFRPQCDLNDTLVELDEWVVTQVRLRSERLFGKALTEDQIRARYAPTLKTNDKGYAPVMRCKMNTQGKAAVKVWQDQKAREPPDQWAGCNVNARIWVKSLYIMGANFGVTFEATDISIIEEPTSECPW